MTRQAQESRKSSAVQSGTGTFYALAAYGAWGFVPLFWRTLKDVPALEIMAHRVVWSLIFFLGVISVRGQMGAFLRVARARSGRRIYAATALLIGANWLIYIHAVNSGHVLESSLGYFINPFVNVCLGLTFLKERLRPAQWASVALAATGVAYLTYRLEALPWIAFSLAITFGFYGLLRKRAPLPSLQGSGLESTVLLAPALCYLGWLAWTDDGAFAHASAGTWTLLACGGVVTALPLLWFSEAAKRMPLTTLGFFQYISPTLQLMCAVFIFGETFTAAHAMSFGLIWSALLLFTLDARRAGARLRRAAALNGTAPR